MLHLRVIFLFVKKLRPSPSLRSGCKQRLSQKLLFKNRRKITQVIVLVRNTVRVELLPFQSCPSYTNLTSRISFLHQLKQERVTDVLLIS